MIVFIISSAIKPLILVVHLCHLVCLLHVVLLYQLITPLATMLLTLAQQLLTLC
jgi:hypothetical protein